MEITVALENFIIGFDAALRAVAGVAATSRSNPSGGAPDGVLDELERRHSAGLMRVNHVGEVCAQALYQAQGSFATSEATRLQFAKACTEEEDHLAWTAERLRELGAGPSLLNPLWYAGAYAVGMVVAKVGGDARSLGFVVETERQVEAHLASHLDSLPLQDAKSRAIVEQMRTDEAAHGATAAGLGAVAAPMPVRQVMRAMAKIMTMTAYYL